MSHKVVRIVGTGRTPVGRLNRSTADLAMEALDAALSAANMKRTDIQALVAIPSLADPHFMQAHYLATKSGLMAANKKLITRTIDTGGAGPISSLATAVNFIRNEWAATVAVVASDAVLSVSGKKFGELSNGSVSGGDLPEPHIPYGYDRYAQWQMKEYGLTREQLAMVPVIMSAMAARHPDAMCRKPYTLDEVLNSRQIAPVTSLYECARRADGAAAVIISSEQHYKRNFLQRPLDGSKPVIVGVGEASGPLYPPPLDQITPDVFSCERATKLAYRAAQLGPKDINFFGLYDCFPICFIRALESVGLCGVGEGGRFVEQAYNDMLANNGVVDQNKLPINTHGGLQCFGAPWEVPAMYNVIEAVDQMSGAAGARQISPIPKRSLVYGNGGVFSASSVAILGDGIY